jgi:hypothetical protein
MFSWTRVPPLGKKFAKQVVDVKSKKEEKGEKKIREKDTLRSRNNDSSHFVSIIKQVSVRCIHFCISVILEVIYNKK